MTSPIEAKEKALEQFTDYFVKNYPGPDTVIYDPKWHAPKIFNAAYSALTSALSGVQTVEVKALDWIWDDFQSIWKAHTVFGEYQAWGWDDTYCWRRPEDSAGLGGPRTIDQAKAAAQSDYEQRIRSALVDVQAVEPVAWLVRDNDDEEFRVAFIEPDICWQKRPLYASPTSQSSGGGSASAQKDIGHD